jgi:putative endonuclease
MKTYFVYIMSNKSRRLYTGITSKLQKRVFEHKNRLLEGFTARYNFDTLVYYEEFSQVAHAITREKQIKSWRREKKLQLILCENPDWCDLSLEWQADPSWQRFLRRNIVPF